MRRHYKHTIAFTFAFLVIILTIGFGCKGHSSKGDDKHAKPWADADSTAQLEADTNALEPADTLTIADSMQLVDSTLSTRDTITTSRGPISGNQYLEGHAGKHAISLSFSTISGNDFLGNATIDGLHHEITGRYIKDDRSQLVLDEAVRERSSTPFHMELHAVNGGYEGTFTTAGERLGITLVRK
ncbi:MAG: hypothetical protein IKX22_06570 [Prevotella sp.]|nr:hypothetical protein [Prevotella sp.]